MKKKLCVISLVTCFACFGAKSQNGPYIAVTNAEQIPWERIEPPVRRFIVAGEAHHVSCIYPFQFSHLKYLVSKGFRNLVWEVPFSYSLIAQQYITTGNDSLLQLIGGYKEVVDYWKGVYELNQTLPEGDKLHFWGIDHELGDIVGGTYRAKLFKKALALLAEGRGDLPPSLQQEFLSLETATTVKALTDIKHRLQLVQHHAEVAALFGERLPHFQILVNRLDYYKVLRNDEMLEAFKEICSLFHLDSSAKFLGRFGWGHTDKAFKKSMAYLLENDSSSPVKNSTFVVGVQYLNCSMFRPNNDVLIENDGVVNDRSQKKSLAALNQQDPTPIKIFTWPPGEKRSGWAKAADVLFVFSGFPGITPLKQNNE
jgi:hypothetical protein